jgi:hypothetical protein
MLACVGPKRAPANQCVDVGKGQAPGVAVSGIAGNVEGQGWQGATRVKSVVCLGSGRAVRRRALSLPRARDVQGSGCWTCWTTRNRWKATLATC